MTLCPALAVGALIVRPTFAVPYAETAKLTASDAATFDLFGESVAISGNTAIVGAVGNNDAGNFSGSAYLFNASTGNQLFKLTASDADSFDFFGFSVAISGNIAIVGADSDSGSAPNSGSAYLFDVTTGNQLFKLTATDAAAFDNFGLSVAISGNTAIVGARFDDDAGSDSGSAYLFDITTGNQLFKLTASDAAAGDFFGESVAISGNIAIVGALANDDAGANSGSAYLFNVTTGNQLFKLTASDAAADDRFGFSVAISGNIAIVGARLDDDGGTDSGSAYLFDITTGNQLFKLTASDADGGDQFGRSVAISGNIAIVGALFDDDAGTDSGSAYLFDVTTGNQLFKLTASDADANDFFGNSVAISGNTAIVGASFDDDDAVNFSGSAFLFVDQVQLPPGVLPEPATAMLGLIGCAALTMRRRRTV